MRLTTGTILNVGCGEHEKAAIAAIQHAVGGGTLGIEIGACPMGGSVDLIAECNAKPGIMTKKALTEEVTARLAYKVTQLGRLCTEAVQIIRAQHEALQGRNACTDAACPELTMAEAIEIAIGTRKAP